MLDILDGSHKVTEQVQVVQGQDLSKSFDCVSVSRSARASRMVSRLSEEKETAAETGGAQVETLETETETVRDMVGQVLPMVAILVTLCW